MKTYFVLRDKNNKQLSSPSLNEDFLTMRIPDMEKRGYEEVHTMPYEDETPKSPEQGASSGMADLLIQAINDEWTTINFYNNFIVTANAEGFSDMADVVQDIVSEENVHVGQLQKLLSTISSNTEEINKGELEAEEQISNPIKTE